MKLQSETPERGVHGKWYGDACGMAFALELAGERWSMLIIRELMLGGRRFSDLRASLPGISARVLTERLAGLEQVGVLSRRKLPPPASAQIYELTEWGYQAEPAIQELGRWAARSPDHDPTLPLSPVSLMLSLRTMLVPEAARALTGTIGFDIGGETFVAELGEGELRVRRAEPTEARAIFRTPVALPLLRVFYGKQALEAVEAEGELRVEGDREFARRFADVVCLPPKTSTGTRA